MLRTNLDKNGVADKLLLEAWRLCGEKQQSGWDLQLNSEQERRRMVEGTIQKWMGNFENFKKKFCLDYLGEY